MSHFFIDRPIFAWVIAIAIMLAGILAIPKLPIEQYPDIAPPTITVNATYPGASAKVVEDSVTQIIEQRMTGLDGLAYIASTSSSSGSASISLSFNAGTDPDIAQVQVQNKLQLAMPQLPEAVQRQGVRVNKSSSGFLMVIAFMSADGSMKQTDIADYVTTNVQDAISRVEGVGNTQVFGAGYAMRIWLDPFKLNQYKLTTAEIKSAIQAQNTQVSAGQLGATPAVPGQQLNATVTAQSRLQTPEQFRAIVLKTATDGALVRLGDVARVEIGSENYDVVSRFKGQASSGLAVTLASGANALDTAEAVRAKLAELEPYFPAGLQAEIPSDASPFIRLSIKNVIYTLLEAIVLVFLVMLAFLRSVRATIIPALTIPVVLLGTMAVLYAAGYSINTLTLFGIVLAIGLLVDDAIVVVENVERLMAEEKLSPREATRKSMGQITGALVGIALVLSAVFVPMAFFGGSTGVIYRQFAITLVAAMVLSVMVALILTPALCASLLKPKKTHVPPVSYPRYQSTVRHMIHNPSPYLVVYVLIIVLTGLLFTRLPTSFLPDEDQGILTVQIRLPAGATQERTLKVIEQVEQHFLEKEKDVIKGLYATAGTGSSGNSQNVARVIVRLVDWGQRPGADKTAQAVAQRASSAFKRIRDASVVVNTPPVVRGLGNAAGFELRLQDRAGLGHEALVAARDEFVRQAEQDERLTGVRAAGQDDTAQYQLDLDFAKAGAMGVTVASINDTLATAWGGSYVSDFIDRGRVKKVYVQGEAHTRMLPDDLNHWYVRNTAGEMVSFSAFATGRWVYGAPVLERFNGMASVEISGAPTKGVSSGTAMQIAENIIQSLPEGIGFEWSGMSAQEKASGAQAPLLYAISMLVVFLALAALYESWSIPFAVMLVVPLGIVGALSATYTRGLSNDVYFQVGLLATIGLSAKNAILIVGFTRELMGQGMGLIESTLEAVRIRLRPILMTSLAFMLGVMPLVVSTGAGSGSQHSVGTGVMGGVLSATLLGIVFVPVFFVMVRKMVSAGHSIME